MTTHTKEIITKNQKHILSFYKGEGGARQFVKDVEDYMHGFRTNPYNAIAYIVNEPRFLFTNYDIDKYLVSLGLDRERFTKFGMWDLYRSLMCRDGAKLYEQLKAGKNPVAPKKAATKRTVKRRV